MNEKGSNSEKLNTRKQKAVVIMGSPSDVEYCSKITEVFDYFGVDYDRRVGSVHRTNVHVIAMLDEYVSKQNKYELSIITIAGLSNALSGVVKGALYYARPPIKVVACPPPSAIDAPSSYRMPSGTVVHYMENPINAALSVVEEFAKNNPELADKLVRYLEEPQKKILDADASFFPRP